MHQVRDGVVASGISSPLIFFFIDMQERLCDCTIPGKSPSREASFISGTALSSTARNCQAAAARFWRDDYFLLCWWKSRVGEDIAKCKHFVLLFSSAEEDGS